MRQGLAQPRRPPGGEALLSVCRDLRCLQLDPTSAVARSHLLVLWSRLGRYDVADFERLVWEERRLFEYWAHAASLVLTEDYAIHAHAMRAYATGDSPWSKRMRAWLAANDGLRSHVLEELEERGPLASRDFEDRSARPWASTGWTGGRNVNRMLALLNVRGEVLVAGRRGNVRLFDLPARCLPTDYPRDELDERDAVERAAELSLRALGVARPKHIKEHFVRGCYPGLQERLADLEARGRIVPASVLGDDGRPLSGPWFVHAEDVGLADRLAAGEWQPRTTLLSPFDNLICDRARTEELFGFRYRLEIYVPKEKRQGFWVMPVLHGDRLIGRADLVADRRSRALVVRSLGYEPGVRPPRRAVKASLDDLADFVGATAVIAPG